MDQESRWYILKGGQKKMRPQETITNANFKVLNRNLSYFLTTSVHC